MFCPSCGALSFPNAKGEIACKNYKCKYKGPANIVVKGSDGMDVDLSHVKTSIAAKGRVFGIVKDSDNKYGALTIGDYSCPQCHKMEVFAYMDHTQEFSETQTTVLTCKNCEHGWSTR